jgi:hypothetical protein
MPRSGGGVASIGMLEVKVISWEIWLKIMLAQDDDTSIYRCRIFLISSEDSSSNCPDLQMENNLVPFPNSIQLHNPETDREPN